MKVELLHFTPIGTVIEACRMPYQSKGGEKMVQRVWDMGHRSIARHGMAVFKVEGVSQSLLRQLSRHPHINLTVKSSRYCDFSNAGFILPPWLKADDKEVISNMYADAMEGYSAVIELDRYTQEQRQDLAKLLLPLGSTTDVIISGNYQALYEFIQLRLCVRAEWEIRSMVLKMVQLLRNSLDVMFGNLDCKARELGYCIEGHSNCGKYPSRKDVEIVREIAKAKAFNIDELKYPQDMELEDSEDI